MVCPKYKQCEHRVHRNVNNAKFICSRFKNAQSYLTCVICHRRIVWSMNIPCIHMQAMPKMFNACTMHACACVGTLRFNTTCRASNCKQCKMSDANMFNARTMHECCVWGQSVWQYSTVWRNRQPYMAAWQYGNMAVQYGPPHARGHA